MLNKNIIYTLKIDESMPPILAESEERQISLITHEKTKRLKAWSFYFLRHCLGQFLNRSDIQNFKIERNGKPFMVNGPNFNVSHSNDMIVIGVSEQSPLGIDIQKRDIKINAQSIQNKFFTENEMKEDFFEIWTKKEAVVKYYGVGLGSQFKHCLEMLDPELSVVSLDIAPDFSCAICSTLLNFEILECFISNSLR